MSFLADEDEPATQSWPLAWNLRGHSDPHIGTSGGMGHVPVATPTWPRDLPPMDPQECADADWNSEGVRRIGGPSRSADGESTNDNSPPATPPLSPSMALRSRLSLSMRAVNSLHRTPRRRNSQPLLDAKRFGSSRSGTSDGGGELLPSSAFAEHEQPMTPLLSIRTTGGGEDDVEMLEEEPMSIRRVKSHCGPRGRRPSKAALYHTAPAESASSASITDFLQEHRQGAKTSPLPSVPSASMGLDSLQDTPWVSSNPGEGTFLDDYPLMGDEEALASSAVEVCSVAGNHAERMVDIMTLDCPEVHLRAILAYKALRGFGWMFRSERNVFHHSQTVEKIEDFWSYSRHSNWCDITTMLLLYYNGMPALFAGCAASLFAPWLFERSCLEENHACLGLRAHDVNTVTVVSMLIGVVVTAAVAILWPTRRRIFLDKACIPQDNDMEKRQGILNLGFFIENSRKMMVLWEPTYFTRLWCVFELAAYLKLQADGFRSHQLEVLPVSYARMTFLCFLGDVAYVLLSYWMMPMYISLPGAICEQFSLVAMVIVFMFLGVGMDDHLRAIHSMTRQLNEFDIEDADCFCCTHGHVNPDTKVPLDCDRLLIQGAVGEWFGDVGAFNDFVRSELQKHISLKATFPYRYALLAFLPHLLYGLARTGELYMVDEDPSKAGCQLVHTLMKVFLLGPAKWSMCFLIFGLQKRRQKAGQPRQAPLTVGRIVLLTAGMTLIRRLWHTLLAYPAPYSLLMQLLVYGPFVLKEYWGHF